MATLQSFITFTGKLGNVIAYKRGNRHFLRSRPETVRQTAATRSAAQRFGAASRKGALIRSAILPCLDVHCHGSLVNRLNSAILQAGRNNHAGLAGFQLNPHAGIRKFLTQAPLLSRDGKLHIPAQAFRDTGDASRMEVKLIATRIDFGNRLVTSTDAAMVHIDLKQPFQGADMAVEAPGKGALIFTVQIRLFREEAYLHNRNFKAADILAVEEDIPREAAIRSKAPPNTQPKTARQCTFSEDNTADKQAFVQRE